MLETASPKTEKSISGALIQKMLSNLKIRFPVLTDG